MSDREERREDELSAGEFRRLVEPVSNWGRWGAEDERGALNYLTPARVLEATRLVRSGETVTLSLPLNTRLGIDNPAPADHHMTMMAVEITLDGLHDRSPSSVCAVRIDEQPGHRLGS